MLWCICYHAGYSLCPWDLEICFLQLLIILLCYFFDDVLSSVFSILSFYTSLCVNSLCVSFFLIFPYCTRQVLESSQTRIHTQVHSSITFWTLSFPVYRMSIRLGTSQDDVRIKLDFLKST